MSRVGHGPAEVVGPSSQDSQSFASTGGYLRSSALLVATSLLARFVGFLRDVVIADKFGATNLTDAYFVANTLPNFLNGVVQGGLASVVVPTVSSDFGQGRIREAYARLYGLGAYMGIAVMVLVLAVSFGAPLLVHLMAPGLPPAAAALGVRLSRILVWTVALAAYAYLGATALQADNRFVFLSLGPVCMSGTATVVLLLVRHPPILLLALGLVAGNILQLLLETLPHLRYRRQLPSPKAVNLKDPAVVRMVSLSWPSMISSAVGQVNAIVDRFFGSFLAAGSITEVTYANRIVQVPLGVFGYAVSNASYPEMARAYANGDYRRVDQLLLRDLRMVLLLSVPVTGLFLALAGPIVAAVYRHGHLTPREASVIVAAFLYYTGSLVPFSVRAVVNRGFFLAGRQRVLANLSIAFVGLNALGDAVLSRLIGAPGLALGTTIDQWISIFLTIWILHRSLGLLPLRASMDAFLRAVGATVPLAVAAYFTASLLAHAGAIWVVSPWGRVARVGVASLAAGIVGVLALWLLRYPALERVAGRLWRRLGTLRAG